MAKPDRKSFLLVIDEVAALLRKEAHKQEGLSGKTIRQIRRGETHTLAHTVESVAQLLRDNVPSE